MTITINGSGTITGATTLASTITGSTLTTPIVTTTMGIGGATPSGSGSGISFPATQSASSDANTLDDYEEGTWTPTLNSFTTSGTLTISGAYTKVGRLVTLTWRLQSTVSITSVVGSTLSNLPFTQSVSGTGTNGISGAGDAGTCQLVNNLIYFTKATTSADWVGSGFYYTS